MKGLNQIREDNTYRPIRLFDNQGETYDRFTLVIMTTRDVYEYFNFSMTPDSVVGINQYAGRRDGFEQGGSLLGEEIELRDAPYEVLTACRVRINNNRPDLMVDAISNFQEMDRMSQLCDLIDSLEAKKAIKINDDFSVLEAVRNYFGMPIYVSDSYLLECIDHYRESLGSQQ